MNKETKKLIWITLVMFFVNKILILIPSIYVNRNVLEHMRFISKIKFLFFTNFAKWDSGWYLKIAQNGYDLKGTAFFPLYPILIKFFSYITKDPVIAGILISNLSFLLVIFFFMKLVRLDYSLKDTYKITLILILFPTSYYFSSLYTESLFMLFSILFLYYLRRGIWLPASLFGMLAGGTRNTGVLLTLPFALEYLIHHYHVYKGRFLNWKMAGILQGALIPLLAFIYMGYLWRRFGDPFSFSHVQKQFGRDFMSPWNTLIQGYSFHSLSIGKILSGKFIYLDIYNVIELFFVTLLLLTLILSFKKIRLSYWIIILYSILIPLTAPAYQHVKDYFVSISRYSLVVVSFYIALFEVFKNKLLYLFLVFSFLILLLALVYFWSKYYWVA